MELRDATVLVTGGAGGIGTAIAAAFASAGARPVTTDLPGRGADVDLDVTDADATARIVAELHVDVVVANAGIGIAGSLADLDRDAFERSIDVNIRGTVNTVLAALPHMRNHSRGTVVLMSSLSGLLGTPLLTPYSMTKFAIVGLAESLRPELAPHGIGVTLVCPGPVETPLLDVATATPGMSVRRYLTASAGPAIAPARLAADIVAAVQRDRPFVAPGRAKQLWRLNRFLPRATAKQIAKNARTELRAS